MAFKKNTPQFSDFASLRYNDKYYICAFLLQKAQKI